MKRKIVILLMTLICGVALIGGTVAYNTVESTAKSAITTSNVKVQINIVGETGQSEKDGQYDIMAGKEVVKKISATNIGKQPAWVRVKAAIMYKGNTYSIKEDGSVVDNTDIVIKGMNTTDWLYSDGYFYYKKALESTETTAQLFEGIAFKTTMKDEYQGEEIKLIVEGYATQQKHNGASPLEAKGWPQE